MSANENAGQPPLERQLRASVSWLAVRGRPARDAMGFEEPERTLAEEREREEERRGR